jgi:hemerythrin
MKVVWKKTYETGIIEIDKQHQKFVKLINDVYEMVEKNDVISLEKLLIELSNYADYHFKTEERLFSENKYVEEETELHLKKHDQFISSLNKLKKEKQYSDMNRAYKLADLLRKWLINHILVYDMRYANYFKDKNLSNFYL